MKDAIKTFEDLEAYKAARVFRVFMSQFITPLLITANIAEGYGRFHYLDTAKFCSNARGSFCETLDHLSVDSDEKIISSELYQQARNHYENAIKRLKGYINFSLPLRR